MHANSKSAMPPKSTNTHRRHLAPAGSGLPAEPVSPTQTVQDATTPNRTVKVTTRGIHPIPEPRADREDPTVPHVNLNPPHRPPDSTGVPPRPQTAAQPLDLSGPEPRDQHTPIERECRRIQEERIAMWRSGALRAEVVELPRRSTENGWTYDRAA